MLIHSEAAQLMHVVKIFEIHPNTLVCIRVLTFIEGGQRRDCLAGSGGQEAVVAGSGL